MPTAFVIESFEVIEDGQAGLLLGFEDAVFPVQTTNLAGHLFAIHYGLGNSLLACIVPEEILAPLPEAPIGDPQFTGHLLQAIATVKIEFNGLAFKLLIIRSVCSWHV